RRTMSDPNDDLEELLSPPATSDTPGLRDAILRGTERRLVVGKWVKRAGKLAAVAAVFALGISVGVWRTVEREKPVPVPQVEVVTVLVPVAVPVVIDTPNQPAAPAETLSAARLELNAEQADDALSAANFYKQAGDRYLTGEQDYANAARCYRMFLARGGDNALSPEPGDSWLLTSLKNAAFKEKFNVSSTDG